jgi:hypothetical protein
MIDEFYSQWTNTRSIYWIATMQREIEDLLSAHLVEKQAETILIKRLLAALALGSTARQRMLDDIAAAASAISAEPQGSKECKQTIPAVDQAIREFRRSRTERLDA